jgi:hypothetical protein
MQIAFRSLRRLRTLMGASVLVAAIALLLGTGSLALAAKHGHKAKKHGRQTAHGK